MKKEVFSWEEIVDDQLGRQITGEKNLREAVFLCALGKLVINAEKYSFNLLVHGASSGGKDWVIDRTLKLFNENTIWKRGRVTPKILNYWKPWEDFKISPMSWDDKVLYLPDISDGILNCGALKVMCSEENTLVTLYNTKVIDIEIPGNPVIIATTANATPNEEIVNRFSFIRVDEDERQTKNIIQFTKEPYTNDAKGFMQSLKRCRVEIPKEMRKKIADVWPTKLIRERRNFPRFLDWVRAVAAFHQRGKNGWLEKAEELTIRADWKDYDIAKDVFMNLYCGKKEIPLNSQLQAIVEMLEKEENPLTTREILDKMGSYITIQNFRGHLNNLEGLRILDKFSQGGGYHYSDQKWAISEEFINKEPIKLPNSDDM